MLEIPLYQTNHIRLCEEKALHHLGLTEDELMARAGAGAFHTLIKLYPNARNIMVFCGSGNNAGDGYVLARLAHERGYTVTINQFKTIENLPAAAQRAAEEAINSGISCQYMAESIDSNVDLIVDALLGTGLHDEVREPFFTAINQINESGIPVFSLDLPSGLEADTGQIGGICVRASTTVTFIAIKIGMLTLEGPDYCGEIVCNDLKLANVVASINPPAYLLNKNLAENLLPPRLSNSHKGNFGHVLIVGGGVGMPGSVCLVAEAAMRVGAGMVTIATHPDHARTQLSRLPEALLYPIEEVEDLEPLIAKATVCVIGPGLGEDDWARNLFSQVIVSQLPMIIDASALRLLADHPQHDDNWVLTPHPGEAASLLDCSTKEVQADRYYASKLLQHNYGGVIVLKGNGTFIQTDKEETYLCNAGNPGMASAGMGDVLSGTIAGLLGQGLTLAEAAKLGVLVHALAADHAAAELGERGLLASDLMPYLRKQVNFKQYSKRLKYGH